MNIASGRRLVVGDRGTLKVLKYKDNQKPFKVKTSFLPGCCVVVAKWGGECGEGVVFIYNILFGSFKFLKYTQIRPVSVILTMG